MPSRNSCGPLLPCPCPPNVATARRGSEIKETLTGEVHRPSTGRGAIVRVRVVLNFKSYNIESNIKIKIKRKIQGYNKNNKSKSSVRETKQEAE